MMLGCWAREDTMRLTVADAISPSYFVAIAAIQPRNACFPPRKGASTQFAALRVERVGPRQR
jgi:hypothetical protein